MFADLLPHSYVLQRFPMSHRDGQSNKPLITITNSSGLNAIGNIWYNVSTKTTVKSFLDTWLKNRTYYTFNHKPNNAHQMISNIYLQLIYQYSP